MESKLFDLLRLKNKKSILDFSKKSQISYDMLKYYNDNYILPSQSDLKAIENASGITRYEVMLAMGVYTTELKELLSNHSKVISQSLKLDTRQEPIEKEASEPIFKTNSGLLYQSDCMDVLYAMDSNSVDLIFADPPFNLNKLYPSNIDDNLVKSEYIDWSEKWIDECIRVLKPGGSFFLWNIPKWNTYFSEYLNHRLTFRNWIATDIKFSLPIQGRLYPSHYSLLYYCKGKKPNYFNPDRLAMEICPKCKNDLKDYGGYKDKMNPKGINMTDVWYDIPPVRHSKYKKRKGANELSIKLLDRIIEMASEPGDVIFDPFGGSGSTYIVAELKERKWIGSEIGPTDEIIDRFENIKEEKAYIEKYRSKYNKLFSKEDENERKKRGLWTCDSFHKDNTLLIPLQ